MEKDNKINAVEQLIDNSKKIAVIPSPASGADALCAALGFYKIAKEKNKTVNIIYSGDIDQELRQAIDEKDVVKDSSQMNLSVSIDYSQTSAEKVAYSTLNNVLTVKIGPVKKDYDLNKVVPVLEGFDFDLIFIFGAKNKESLGDIYLNLGDDFRKASIVNFDISGENIKYGDFNIVDTETESLSLLALNFLAKGGFKIDQKTAKVLLRGMTSKN